MNNHGEKLVSRNILDGLLLGINEANHGVATRISVRCGYNPEDPHAFYPVAVIVCLDQQLAHLLRPDQPDEQAHFALGQATVKGYIRTIVGAIYVSRQPAMGIQQLINYYIPILSREMPGVGNHIVHGDAYHTTINITNCPLHPAFLQGCLMQLLETAECEQPQCAYQEEANCECIYQLSWQQAPKEIKAKLFLKLGAQTTLYLRWRRRMRCFTFMV